MNANPVDVSVIIVNYNVKHFAEQCLRSVQAASRDPKLRVEIFLIDNYSTDGSVEYLQPKFPDVQFIVNQENLGFGRANNQAFARAQGKYFLILNPDTLVAEDTLQALVAYLEAHPKVGAVGPKILTRDGAFDITSKRGLPTPWVAFYRLSGLARLFPHSHLFARYNLLYLDPDQPAVVDALVGSCMMVRRAVYDQIGGFDEDFFMFGEDIDWCYRIKLAGWEVHYTPVTRIVHFKGESTRRSPIDREQAFYGAMHLFVDKHFRGKYPFGTHGLISLGIIMAQTAAQAGRLWRRVVWALLDGLGLLAVLLLGRWLRWGGINMTWIVALVLTMQIGVWLASLTGMGAYGRRRGQTAPVTWALLLGFLINSSLTYFIKQIAFSRLVLLFAMIVGGVWIFTWRAALRRLVKTAPWRRFYRRRTFIVGAGSAGRSLVEKLRRQTNQPYQPVGIIDPTEEAVGSLIAGVPVLGSEEELDSLIAQEEIEEVLFAYDRLDYDRVLKVISRIASRRGINFKVITPEAALESDGLAPMLSVEYLAPRGLGGALRRISTLVTKG